MREPVSELDRRFMAAAIRLGAGALGTTWPNPAVGAIVVREGRVVGRGRTAGGGRPHAETLALAEAGEAARGATIYVSLEPCSHHGRTPPCSRAVIDAGIARVVTSISDPDPRVAGRGIAQLEHAGIAVAADVLAPMAERANAGHLTRVRHNRPLVTLKLAVSADDAIGRVGEAQAVVTGPDARRHVHALRSRADAILVGSGTVEADDPLLTCRLPGLEGRSPVRVILDTHSRLGQDRRVFADDGVRTWVFTSAEEDSETGLLRRIFAPRDAAGLDLDAVLGRLAADGITRAFVEGGARLARSLLEQELVDDIILFRSPEPIGQGAVPALAGLSLSEIEASDRFRSVERRRFGPDLMTRYERAR